MPLPPPPAAALTRTGKAPVSPCGTTGTPAATAISRAASLRAIASIAAGGGPIHATTGVDHGAAKPAFSDRKP